MSQWSHKGPTERLRVGPGENTEWVSLKRVLTTTHDYCTRTGWFADSLQGQRAQPTNKIPFHYLARDPRNNAHPTPPYTFDVGAPLVGQPPPHSSVMSTLYLSTSLSLVPPASGVQVIGSW